MRQCMILQDSNTPSNASMFFGTKRERPLFEAVVKLLRVKPERRTDIEFPIIPFPSSLPSGTVATFRFFFPRAGMVLTCLPPFR